MSDINVTIWNGAYAPKGTPKAVIDKLWDWLQRYGQNHRGERLPDKESLRKALDAMHKNKMIRLPWK